MNEFETYYSEYFEDFKKKKELIKKEESYTKSLLFKWKDSIEYKCLYHYAYSKNIKNIILKEVKKISLYITEKEAELKVKESIVSLLVKEEELPDTSAIKALRKELEFYLKNLDVKEENIEDIYEKSIYNIMLELASIAFDEGIEVSKKDISQEIENLNYKINENYKNILWYYEDSILKLKYDNDTVSNIVKSYTDLLVDIKMAIIKMKMLNEEDLKQIYKTINSIKKLLLEIK